MSFGHQQMMTDAMTPLGLSFFQNQFAETPLIEAGGRLYIDMAPDLASPVGRRIVRATLKRIDPLIDSAVRKLMKRHGFIENLSRDGQRYLKLNSGAGYFTWRLPVEALKLYRSNDPNAVAALRVEHDHTLDRVERRLGTLSGDESFSAILDALRHEMKDEVTDPRNMGVVYVGMYALNWVNKHMEKWLGVKSAGDRLLTSVANDVTAEMGLALLDVADTVRIHPAVSDVLPTRRRLLRATVGCRWRRRGQPVDPGIPPAVWNALFGRDRRHPPPVERGAVDARPDDPHRDPEPRAGRPRLPRRAQSA
jgi:pyruvate,water dikinase